MRGSSWVYPSKTPTVNIRNRFVFLSVCPSVSRHPSLPPDFSNPGQYLCRHPPVGGRKVKTVQSWALLSLLCHPYQLPGAAGHICQTGADQSVWVEHSALTAPRLGWTRYGQSLWALKTYYVLNFSLVVLQGLCSILGQIFILCARMCSKE